MKNDKSRLHPRELQKDGTISLTIIAKKLNVSIGTIRNFRLARLMEDKTVQIIGRIDPNKVGFHAIQEYLFQ